MRRLLAVAAIAVALVPALSAPASAARDLPPILCSVLPDPETGEYYCFP